MEKQTIVLGVIGADCHSVGNKILELFFTSEGFKVVNLGVMVSQQEFINAAIETNAKAILVSSLYGHGEIDCQGFRDLCTEKGLDRILLYVGGNLVVGKTPFEVVEKKFKDMGFDRVFSPDVDLKKVAELLRQDIREKFRADSKNSEADPEAAESVNFGTRQRN
ncbi:MAG: methylaspartate mutase subunit S [Candidatus Saccharicenans sp.]|nr:methylaspartate mutase subunit S [Candidatus Saccharicenans sp.]MDI6849681.1 methylaspartate mutase subunit S [Candidatus Saccharicenans sp.]